MVAGLAVALHPVVGMWFCVGIAMSEMFLRMAGRLETPVLQHLKLFALLTVSAIVVSLPGLWPAMKLVLFHDATPKESLDANLIQVFYRLAHHLDPTTFSNRAWVHTGVLLAVAAVGGTLQLRTSQKTRT